MESKLIPMLLAMRQRGVRVDLDRAEQLYENLTTKQDETSAADQAYDRHRNRAMERPQSRKGLRPPRTGISRGRRRPTLPSFTKAWLEHHPHPVTDLIRRVRHLDKLRETFIKGFILEGHTNGRIYTQFNQLRSDSYGTVSGRLSSSHAEPPADSSSHGPKEN